MASLYVAPNYVAPGYTLGENIFAELHKLNAGAWVDLFELDLTPMGGDLIRFHAGTNKLRQPVVWQGNTYQPFPIQVDGFEATGSGEMPRPRLRVANVSGIISALVRDYDDLIGMRLTRKRTMVQYLDDVNFPARRNLLQFTEALDNAFWVKTGAGTGSAPVVTPDAAMGPFGEQSADRVVFALGSGTTSADRSDIGPNTGLTTVVGQPYWFSYWARTDDGSRPILRQDFNGTAGTVPLAAITGEWQRFSTFLATATDTARRPFLRLRGGVGSSASASILVAGLQFENAAALSDYQPVLGSTFVRNPTADPYSFLPDEAYFVVQKVSENRLIVEFELGGALDLQGVMLPRRQILASVCAWRYRDAETCGYAGPAVADRFDQPTSDLAVDNCSHTLGGCKLRFGATAVLPFGGFPSAGLTRQ